MTTGLLIMLVGLAGIVGGMALGYLIFGQPDDPADYDNDGEGL